jgi:hypothetical protein
MRSRDLFQLCGVAALAIVSGDCHRKSDLEQDLTRQRQLRHLQELFYPPVWSRRPSLPAPVQPPISIVCRPTDFTTDIPSSYVWGPWIGVGVSNFGGATPAGLLPLIGNAVTLTEDTPHQHVFPPPYTWVPYAANNDAMDHLVAADPRQLECGYYTLYISGSKLPAGTAVTETSGCTPDDDGGYYAHIDIPITMCTLRRPTLLTFEVVPYELYTNIVYDAGLIEDAGLPHGGTTVTTGGHVVVTYSERVNSNVSLGSIFGFSTSCTSTTQQVHKLSTMLADGGLIIRTVMPIQAQNFEFDCPNLDSTQPLTITVAAGMKALDGTVVTDRAGARTGSYTFTPTSTPHLGRSFMYKPGASAFYNTCGALHSRCDVDGECCGNGRMCRSKSCCVPPLGTCTSSSDCCIAGEGCTSGRCCSGSGGWCGGDVDCCNGLSCLSGACIACESNGATCVERQNCCSGYCPSFDGGPSRCCSWPSQQCMTAADCCSLGQGFRSLRCVGDGGFNACTCAQSGSACQTSTDCCSLGDTCSSSMCCTQRGMSCNSSSQCCSGLSCTNYVCE